MKEKLKIFIICGEKSGANIMYEILETLKSNLSFELYGITNEKTTRDFTMKEIFPMSDISKMGITNVIKNIFTIFSRIKTTRKEILKIKPDLIITVDSYDFCIQVTKYIKKINPNQKIFHIVSPSVWLYRKSRIKEMEKVYNLLMCIFPEEITYYKDSKLKVEYIGNLTFDHFKPQKEKDRNLIAITIGSREQEIKSHIKLIKGIIEELLIFNKDLIFCLLATEYSYKLIQNYFIDIKNIKIITDEKLKKHYISSSYFAIAKSGTNTLEFTASEVPILVYYKTSWVNAIIAKFIIGIKYVNIINIFKNQPIIKEFLQHRANIKNIVDYTINIISNKEHYKKEVSKLKEINKEFRNKTNKTIGQFASELIILNIA